jgi:hypothetical protein
MTTPNSLRARALPWLRAEMNVLTHDAPAQRQGTRDDDRRTTVLGTVAAPSRAGRFAYGGLYAWTAAGVVAMVASRHGLEAGLQRTFSAIAVAALVGGAVLLVLAWRSRPTTAAVRIELLGEPQAPTAAEVKALRGESSADALWLVTDAPWTADALAEARALGVRCFGPQGRGFAEITDAG